MWTRPQKWFTGGGGIGVADFRHQIVKRGRGPSTVSRAGRGGRWTRPPPTVSNCFLLLPTVSISLESQLYLWTTDSAIITTFNTFPRNPSAHRLLEIMHVGFQRNTQKKTLVKFNSPRPWASVQDNWSPKENNTVSARYAICDDREWDQMRREQSHWNFTKWVDRHLKIELSSRHQNQQFAHVCRL